MKIKIIKVPPSSIAPIEIREAWVGVEIPLAEDQNPTGRRAGQENMGGYAVSTEDAITALRAAGKEEAAEFWEDIKRQLGHTLVFNRDCCEVLD